jgi:hypothetical protein
MMAVLFFTAAMLVYVLSVAFSGLSRDASVTMGHRVVAGWMGIALLCVALILAMFGSTYV